MGIPPAQSAAVVNRILTEGANSAILSAFNNAEFEAREAGHWPPQVDSSLVEENTYEEAGRALVRTFHGDSAHQPWLTEQRAVIGPPSSHTTLRDGTRFDARSLGSALKNHRTTNNRLINRVSAAPVAPATTTPSNLLMENDDAKRERARVTAGSSSKKPKMGRPPKSNRLRPDVYVPQEAYNIGPPGMAGSAASGTSMDTDAVVAAMSNRFQLYRKPQLIKYPTKS